MNKLLERQIKRYLGNIDSIPQELELLFNAISDAYDGFDADRILIERSFDISSRELTETNRKLSQEIKERIRTEENLIQLLEQLEKTNTELNDFMYIASHDLKTPLRGIATLANWILKDYEDKFDEQGKEKINLLMTRVGRMYSLLNGILRYSRLGRIKEEKIMVDFNKLVTEVVDVINPPENIKVIVANELPVIQCEKSPISQVFSILISNAVKYMDKPHGRIKICSVEENGFWKFSVADNGPGIEEKYFEKIFQIFQSLSPRDEFESTGIGLAMIKKIIESYGGRIWVKSKVGSGTTFLFTLPIQEMKAEDIKLEAGITG